MSEKVPPKAVNLTGFNSGLYAGRNSKGRGWAFHEFCVALDKKLCENSEDAVTFGLIENALYPTSCSPNNVRNASLGQNINDPSSSQRDFTGIGVYSIIG